MKHRRKRIVCGVAAAALLSAAPCLAAELLTPILGCRTLADSAARLACFDRESATLAAAGGSATSPTAAAPAPAPAASGSSIPAPVAPAPVLRPLQAKENFGLPDTAVAQKEVAAGIRTPDLKKIDAHIVAVSVAAGGVATFTLDNGQVWRELLSEGDLLAKPGDPATVSRGVFNSYSLKLKSGRSSKVTRIQ